MLLSFLTPVVVQVAKHDEAGAELSEGCVLHGFTGRGRGIRKNQRKNQDTQNFLAGILKELA